MASPDLQLLVVALGGRSQRVETASRLAAHLGVAEVVLLVKDAGLHTLVPAPGMPQTLRGGSAWRAFIKRCETAGQHVGQVDLSPHGMRRAIAFSTDGGSLLLIGAECCLAPLEGIFQLLPLLTATFCAEHQLVLAAEEARDARDSEHRARALAGALDQARAEAARLNAELREEDRRKDEFLATLAHELRNPLAPLITSIALLRKQYPDGPGQRTIEIMSRQAGHLTRLVEDLMDVSRVRQGKVDLRVEPVDLRAIVAAAVEENFVRFSAKQHRVSVNEAKEPLVVMGDPARLTQMLNNLLTNAAKYTDPGGEIRVSIRSQPGLAVVDIADNGIGIEASMLPRIFGLFAQARGALERAQGGLGIGLNLVKELAELHEGSITVQSDGPGCGSTFTIRIPLARTK